METKTTTDGNTFFIEVDQKRVPQKKNLAVKLH